MAPPAQLPFRSEISQLISRARRAARQSSLILQYDPLSRDLRTWLWPVDAEGARLTPEALESLQNDVDCPEDFKAPCCVCPHGSTSVWHAECEIIMAQDGYHLGEYIARCAGEACKYIVPLDRLYAHPGLLLRSGPFAGRPSTSASTNSSTAAKPSASHLRRPAMPVPLADVSNLEAWLLPSDPVDSTLDRLLRLNRDGLKIYEFVRLFAKCSCGRVMTRKAFEDHTCIPTASAYYESE